MLTKTLINLKQTCPQCPEIAHRPHIPNIEFDVSKGFMPSKAAGSALADIMQALETDGVTVIGLYGMTGVGKTTLTNQLKENSERRNLFNECVCCYRNY